MARMKDQAPAVPRGDPLGPRRATAIEHSVSTRQIANGHIVTTTSYNADTGDQSRHEEFHEHPPDIEPPRVHRRDAGSAGSESLKRAVDHAKR